MAVTERAASRWISDWSMRPAIERSWSVSSTAPRSSPSGAESTATVCVPMRGVDSRTPNSDML
ncbi:hypothetical protein D3C83_205780 [compost metagenome]